MKIQTLEVIHDLLHDAVKKAELAYAAAEEAAYNKRIELDDPDLYSNCPEKLAKHEAYNHLSKLNRALCDFEDTDFR